MTNSHQASIAASSLFWGHSGEDWDACLIWSVVLAAIAAGLVGIATIGSIRSHKLESDNARKELENYKVETDGRVADATLKGIEAGEKAGRAESGVFAASIQLEKQKALTATAIVRAELLRQQLSWRELSELQLVRMIEEAKRAPGAVNIQFVAGDPEAQALAEQYKSIFVRSGWRLGFASNNFGSPVYGVQTISTAPSRLTDVLKAGKIEFASGAPGHPSVGFMSVSVENAETLYIGSKARPSLADEP